MDRYVGQRLRERRVMLGLTRQQLAGLVGTTYQQAHKYESGLNRVSAGRLLLARALGVAPGCFFEGLVAPARPLPRQRQVLELARSFAGLSRPQQEALCELARARFGRKDRCLGRLTGSTLRSYVGRAFQHHRSHARP
jgi:transcriptional regulator with XRE-family HTH domain